MIPAAFVIPFAAHDVVGVLLLYRRHNIIVLGSSIRQVITDERLWTNVSVQERSGTESVALGGEFVLRTRDGVDDLDVVVGGGSSATT